MNNFWAYTWLDNHDLTTFESIHQFLSTPQGKQDLIDCARGQLPPDPCDLVPENRFTLFAGRGIALSGRGACSGPSCIKGQVDNLLLHIWHYFDRIIADDITDDIARKSVKSFPTPFIEGWLWAALYARDIGADNLIEYRRPIHKFCETCGVRHALKQGLNNSDKLFHEVVEYVLQGAKMELREHTKGGKRGKLVELRSPALEISRKHFYSQEEIGGLNFEQIKRTEAEHVISIWLTAIGIDLEAAREASSPLGTTSKFASHVLRRYGNAASTASDLAFNLELPVIKNIDARTLVKLRVDHSDAFHNFQMTLRAAIRERIANIGAADERKIHDSLIEDLIEPGLAEVGAAVKSANTLANQSRTVGVVGTVATTIGASLMTTNPAVAGVALAAASTATAMAVSAFGNSRANLSKASEHSMYFLFKALAHAKNDHSADLAQQMIRTRDFL
jgi:hypothetical protein